MVTPPAAALPMATEAPGAVPPAPEVLPPAPMPVAYAPPPQPQRYGYVDRAYSMTQAFADTPPDYAVDYQGTRPWIWRAENGAYRIVERLPRGERYYYYEPGADQPFFVQDPNYGYAYDNGRLASVYGPDGAEIADALAARRAQEASAYLYRSRQLYRAAQYQQRQSAYASEWATRQDDLRHQDAVWQRQEASNADWRSWHHAHAPQLQQQWQPERDQRQAYAAVLGIGAAAPANRQTRATGNPADVARRQAAVFAKWKGEPNGQASPATAVSGNSPPAAPLKAASVAEAVKTSALAHHSGSEPAEAAVPVNTVADIKAGRKAQAAQDRAAAAAQAKTAQAQHAQQVAVAAQQREAAAAKETADQQQQATQLAGQGKQHRAMAQQAQGVRNRTNEAKAAQAAAAQAKAAKDKAAQAQHAEAAAAQAKRSAAGNAQAKAAEAKAAQAKAGRADAAAAQANSAQAKADQAKAPKAKGNDQASKGAKKKRGAPKDRQTTNQQ